MSIIASSMHRDALLTIGSDDSNIAREIIAMDDEVDRFSLYIIRLLKAAVSDNIVLKGSGIKTSRECLGYRLITKSIERMADHAAKIAQNSLTLTLTTLNKEILEEVGNLSNSALKVFENAVNSLFERDYNTADKVIEEAESIRKMEANAVNKIIKIASPRDVPALRLIVESLLRTAEYGADIAEIVLNMTIEGMIRET
jgi:phosphate uptake regulator